MSNHLVIERIATEETLCSEATTADKAFVEQFGSASRRCEALAWRAIVRRELGAEVEISYDEYGAPQVNLPNIYISVSHSRDMVAVLFSSRRCAVDIESVGRNFRRVASRYLSDAEQGVAEQNDIYAEMWSAKEALYKYHRKGELDLVKDIAIKAYDADRGVLIGSILDGADIELSIQSGESFVVAVID